MPDPAADPIYNYTMQIPADSIDGNGHVNNVSYVQWMQDAAIRQFDALGGTPRMAEVQATWVVRSHHVEYLAPAFAGEEIEVRTWIANVRRVRSLRRYEFLRLADRKLLVRGETDWVFLDARTGRPTAIPDKIASLFHLLEQPPLA
jgi:acyl-CoA thioester hydrolase